MKGFNVAQRQIEAQLHFFNVGKRIVVLFKLLAQGHIHIHWSSATETITFYNDVV